MIGRAELVTPLNPGDLVRLKRGETLLLKGANFTGANKGQEFTMLRREVAEKAIYLDYLKKDGTHVEVSVPAEALEAAPAEGWSDLLRGVEAFRDGNYPVSRAFLQRAGQDATYKPLATAIAPRLVAATSNLAPARELSVALCKMGHYSLGVAVDAGADRLGRMPGAAPSKLDKAEATKRAATGARTAMLCRQAYAQHRTKEAAALAKEGLEAEPVRPDLLTWQKKCVKDLSEAEDCLRRADEMRTKLKGEEHAITALQMGLKLAADHPGLIALKANMQGQLEERTAPPLTPALLAAAKASASPILEEGRKLYTTRCAECHDLELLESRSASGWERMVGGMAGRAKLSSAQQAQIMAYITVAWNATQQ